MTKQEIVFDFLHHRGTRGATGMDLFNNGGGFDYRKRVSELRKDGYEITSKWMKTNGSRFKRYFLER